MVIIVHFRKATLLDANIFIANFPKIGEFAHNDIACVCVCVAVAVVVTEQFTCERLTIKKHFERKIQRHISNCTSSNTVETIRTQ